MFQFFKDAFYSIKLVMLEEEMLDSEVILQTFERGEAVFVEPKDL